MEQIAQSRGLQLVVCTFYHWQIRDGQKILCNIWPTKRKKLDWWPKNGTTKQYKENSALIQSAEDLVNKYRSTFPEKQAAAKPETKNPEPKTSKPAPSKPKPRPQPSLPMAPRQRFTRADVTLHGKQLRIAVHTHSFTESFRLSDQDTELFLLSARCLLEEISEGDIIGELAEEFDRPRVAVRNRLFGAFLSTPSKRKDDEPLKAYCRRYLLECGWLPTGPPKKD